MGNFSIPGEDKRMTSRFCRIHSVSRGIDNFDSSQVRPAKDGTKMGGRRETGIFKSPFFKGRFAKSTLPFYCNFLSLPHWKLPTFLWGARHPTSLETLSDPWSDLRQRGVLSVSIIVCYQHLNIYGSRLCCKYPEINSTNHWTLDARYFSFATSIAFAQYYVIERASVLQYKIIELSRKWFFHTWRANRVSPLDNFWKNYNKC